MSGPGAARTGLACTDCGRPFGFAVSFCPFCGVAQHPAQPGPAAAGSVPDTRAQPARPPAAPPPPVRVVEAPRQPPPAAAASAAEAYRAADAGTKPAARQALPARPGRLRALAFLAAIATFAWFSTGQRPPEAVLVVSVQPAVRGAVLVDGKPAGRAGERLRVPAGSHMIGFDAEGWSAPTRQLALDGGRTRTLRLDLTGRPALLTLRPEPPDATIRLDGRILGGRVEEHGGMDEHKVAPGWHRLVATHPGFAPLVLQMTLGRGERRVIPLLLSPLPVRTLGFEAPVGAWSEPVTLPARTDFTLAFDGRLRLRVGREVYLLGPGGSVNLGDVRARTIQVKAVDDLPVAVRLSLRSQD